MRKLKKFAWRLSACAIAALTVASTSLPNGTGLAAKVNAEDDEEVTDPEPSESPDNAARGYFSVREKDDDIGSRAQGDNNLKGYYAVINRSSNAVTVDANSDGTIDPGKETFQPGEVIYDRDTQSNITEHYSFVTAEDGKYTWPHDSKLEQLPSGSYDIKEVQAPENYTTTGIAQTHFDITEDGQCVDCVLSNKAAYGKVQIRGNEVAEENGTKYLVVLTSKLKSPLGGSMRSAWDVLHQIDGNVIDENGNILISSHEYSVITADTEGKGLSGDLAAGKYSVAQFVNDNPSNFDGWKMKGSVKNISITSKKTTDGDWSTWSSNDNIRLDFTNDENKTVKVIKTDMHGTAVAGAELTVYEINDAGSRVQNEAGTDKVVYSWTTDKDTDGVKLSSLETGRTYEIVETKTPEGFATMKPHRFTVSGDGKDQTEKVIDKHVEISVKDADGNEVPGAVLTVTDEDGNVVDTWTSDENTHYASGLEVGKTYTLREVSAPSGYVKATEITFTVTDDGVDQKVTMVDALVHTAVKKVDETGKAVAGATLQIIDKETGKVVDTVVSTGDEEGVDISRSVIGGRTYILHESAAPFGYNPADDEEFTVSGSSKAHQLVLATGRARHFCLTVVKQDAADRTKVLKGAEITVYNRKSGKAVRKGTTDETGRITWEMPYSQDGYTVVETGAPQGYSLEKDSNGNPVKHDVSVLADNIDDAEKNPVVIRVNDQVKTVFGVSTNAVTHVAAYTGIMGAAIALMIFVIMKAKDSGKASD